MIGAKKSWHCQTTSRRRCQWHHRRSRYRFQDQHQLLLLLLLDHWIHHSMDLIQWCDQNGNLRMCHTQKGETGNISCIILKNILVILICLEKTLTNTDTFFSWVRVRRSVTGISSTIELCSTLLILKVCYNVRIFCTVICLQTCQSLFWT